MNNQDVHPIELFLAALLNLIEFSCWVINELLGHHASKTPTNAVRPTQTAQPTGNPNQQTYQQLTVKQLRKITGITNSRYRKADLIRMALTHASDRSSANTSAVPCHA